MRYERHMKQPLSQLEKTLAVLDAMGIKPKTAMEDFIESAAAAWQEAGKSAILIMKCVVDGVAEAGKVDANRVLGKSVSAIYVDEVTS
jgi:hypothetical protein